MGTPNGHGAATSYSHRAREPGRSTTKTREVTREGTETSNDKYRRCPNRTTLKTFEGGYHGKHALRDSGDDHKEIYSADLRAVQRVYGTGNVHGSCAEYGSSV
jgi:hypothetical protein